MIWTVAATISWKTNEAATSQIFYDTQFHPDIADYAYHTGEDTTLVTGHDIHLANLYRGTTYHFRLRSVVNSIEAVSNDYTFTTRTPSVPGPEPEPPDYYETVDLFGETSEWPISNDGQLIEDVEITSQDGKTNVYIPEGTYCLDEDGKRQKGLIIEIKEKAPEPPENYLAVGTVYNFGPDGTTFSPYLKLTLSYEEEDISEGIEEEDLIIAFYNKETEEWIELDSIVDAGNNTITAFVEHFTTFSIIGMVITQPTPAVFSVTSLRISPNIVNVGESVTISVLVANDGGKAGSYDVMLKINGVLESTKRVIINAGFSKEVIFITSKDTAGTYTVEVDGFTDSFTVGRELVIPAEFISSDLVISPGEVYVDEMVSIKVLVTNTGDESDSYVVTLKINSMVEGTKEVTINAGFSKEVTFTTSRDVAGLYLVDVDGLTGSFTVKEKAARQIPKRVNWLLIGGSVAGLLVIGMFVYFLAVRRRRKVKEKKVPFSRYCLMPRLQA